LPLKPLARKSLETVSKVRSPFVLVTERLMVVAVPVATVPLLNVPAFTPPWLTPEATAHPRIASRAVAHVIEQVLPLPDVGATPPHICVVGTPLGAEAVPVIAVAAEPEIVAADTAPVVSAAANPIRPARLEPLAIVAPVVVRVVTLAPVVLGQSEPPPCFQNAVSAPPPAHAATKKTPTRRAAIPPA